jgi:AhpC/TSA family
MIDCLETSYKQNPKGARMKHSLLSAIILTLVSAFPAHALEIGKAAPDFKAKDIAGVEQSISQYKGKIVVLEWTNPGCPFVRKHYDGGNMQGLQKENTGKGVVWLSINSSAEGKEGSMDAAGAKASVEKEKANPSAYILDPEGTVGKLYGAKTTPHMFIIAADGTLAYEGAIDDKATADPEDIKTSKNYVQAAVDALLAGKPVETPQTRAYGCSVKYKS